MGSAVTAAVILPGMGITQIRRRGRFDATVQGNERICREHYRLRLRINGQRGTFPPTQPGQFVQLGCRPPNGVMDTVALFGRELVYRPDEPVRASQAELCAPMAMLRRPFSLAGRGDDDDGTWLEIVHRVVGVGTAWLAQLKAGDAVDLIGPLGNAFTLPTEKRIGLLVGGGVGLPPMFYLAEALHRAGWRAVGFVGALTGDLLAVTPVANVAPSAAGEPALCVGEFARYGYPAVLTTDDGTCGLRGRITDGLERVLAAQSPDEAARSVVYACGPGPMMHAAAQLARHFGVDCQVCLEQAMACGMGTCQSCVVRIQPHGDRQPHGTTADGRPWRYNLACTDGPVFAAERVVW